MTPQSSLTGTSGTDSASTLGTTSLLGFFSHSIVYGTSEGIWLSWVGFGTYRIVLPTVDTHRRVQYWMEMEMLSRKKLKSSSLLITVGGITRPPYW